MTIGAVHLPEVWHHTDEEFQSACEDVSEILTQMDAGEGSFMLGCDASAVHSYHDCDEENVGEIGAQEKATARSDIWPAFVRGSGCRAAKALRASRTTRALGL